MAGQSLVTGDAADCDVDVADCLVIKAARGMVQSPCGDDGKVSEMIECSFGIELSGKYMVTSVYPERGSTVELH